MKPSRQRRKDRELKELSSLRRLAQEAVNICNLFVPKNEISI
jgi:hypothetical protein